jgi:uncharacterized sulfatase
MNTPEKGATMQGDSEGRKIRQARRSRCTLFPPVESQSRNSTISKRILTKSTIWLPTPEYKDKLDSLRKSLTEWQLEIGDLGLLPESLIEMREQDAGSTYGILRTEDDPSQFIRELTEVATKASDGPSAFSDLVEALSHTDAAIRYWGATGLGNFAEQSADFKGACSGPEKCP